MKILVIFTGGTIQSSVGENYISLDESTKYTLINNFNKNRDLKVKFDVLCPYSILSENLSAKELSSLCQIVESKIDLGYDGIIITHGTDTLQYSAAALAFTVNTKNVPVVLVSANYPLENEQSNGNDNFLGAVKFIANYDKGGVFVSYRNSCDGPIEIFNATTLLSHNEIRDEICALDGAFATYSKTTDALTFANTCLPINGKGAVGSAQFVCDPKILLLNSVPGDNFNYDLSRYNAVLIKPYHSGTLNTENERLVEFCKKAKEMNIPIFVPNVKGGKNYQSTENYDNLSLVVLPLSATPAIYVKIWLAVSLNKNVKDFVLDEIIGEFLN